MQSQRRVIINNYCVQSCCLHYYIITTLVTSSWMPEKEATQPQGSSGDVFTCYRWGSDDAIFTLWFHRWRSGLHLKRIVSGATQQIAAWCGNGDLSPASNSPGIEWRALALNQVLYYNRCWLPEGAIPLRAEERQVVLNLWEWYRCQMEGIILVRNFET